MKVTIGLLLAHGYGIPSEFFESYCLLQQWLITGAGNVLLPPGRKVESSRLLIEKNFPIDWARNHCCKAFLDADDGDYLLFLDVDMVHPPDIAHRLIARDKDIVSAQYVTRRPPYLTVAMRKVGDGPTDYQSISKLVEEERGLLEVDSAGAGALLISRVALKALRARIGDDWFRYQDGPDGLRSRSEDMWFFEQAKAAGFQAYLDADVKCDHLESRLVNSRHCEPWKKLYLEAKARLESEVPA